MHTLKWAPYDQPRVGDWGISMIELYANYVEVTQQFLPISIRECSAEEQKYCDFVPFLSEAGRQLPASAKTIARQSELLGQTMNPTAKCQTAPLVLWNQSC